MAVYLRLVNHDALFEQLKSQPIIVNRFNLDSQVQMEQLNSLIYTTYSGDVLEILPSCDCGKLKGEHNVGLKCNDCGSMCLAVTEKPLESVLWITPPEGIDYLVNPEVWIILRNELKDGGVSVLDWLTNPLFKVPFDKEPQSIKKLKAMNMPRSFNYFCNNFDTIMDTLFNGKVIMKRSVKKREEIMQFLAANKPAILSKHLPIPSRLAFITENTAMGAYADSTIALAVDAIRTISDIENSITPLSVKSKESKIVHALNKLSDYYYSFYDTSLRPKLGWFRRHIFGSRTHFSFRAVITSLHDVHEYDEIHLPWSLSVQFLKVHLISKLLKRGFSPNDAIGYIYKYTLEYNPLLDEIFQELIRESPYNGIPILLNRNPTLTRGSVQQLRVTKIKTDPDINAISLSVLILRALNADQNLINSFYA